MERSRARGTNRKVRGERRRRRSRKKKKKEKKEIIFKTPRREVDLETSRPRPLRFRVWCVVVPFFFFAKPLSLSRYSLSSLSLYLSFLLESLHRGERGKGGEEEKREREREREPFSFLLRLPTPFSLFSLFSLLSLHFPTSSSKHLHQSLRIAPPALGLVANTHSSRSRSLEMTPAAFLGS